MMKNIQDISWNEWVGLARRHSRYVLVMVIFLVFVFYAVVVVPGEPSKKSKLSSSRSINLVEWNITTEKPEKVFLGVLHGLPGDWYRVGVSTIASRDARIDVSLYSVFSEDISVGSFDIAASDDYRYHEILFQIPSGTFSDIRFVLQGNDSNGRWSYAGIKLSEFALSRLSVKNKSEAERLAPTLAGNIEHAVKMLAMDKPATDSNVIFESRFVADADFIESVRLNAKEKSKNKDYVLELRGVAKGGAYDADISIKRVILDPGELRSVQDEWGNQSVALPARLERGKEYIVTLTGTGGASRNLIFSPLQGLQGTTSDEKNTIAIVFGRYAYADGGALLSGAKVEDFGNEILYSYALSGEVNDFFDLFDTEGSVKFDTKQKMVVGEQKQRTSFTYRFFTVYPFERFALSARQAGDKEKEVKLEYSFDKEFWKEVPVTQAHNKSQIFSLALAGTGKQDTVYIRASYNGEDKKTDSFGLDQLSVRAKLTRK